MPTKGLNPVWHLRRIALLHEGAGLPDAKLLGMFVDQGDEVAFEALMRRHGPMVHGVCRRILGNDHDAQDAAQATFLVLVRKAKAVVPREMVSNWLYVVARLTAMKMRSQNAKRWRREKQVAVMPEPQGKTSEATDDWLILDQELSHLPDKYRIAIIACDLEGKTHKQAARQLNWPEGTLDTRLARGRKMLAKRLGKRGVILSVEALALALTNKLASASLPPGVVSSTVKAASLIAAGKTVATGLVSAKVTSIAGGMMKTMLLTKLKTMAMVLTVVGTLGIGAGAYSVSGSTDSHGEGGNQERQRRAVQGNTDLAGIQGKWEIVSAVRNGEKVDNNSFVWTITDEHFVYEHSAKDAYKLNTATKPRQIDITVVEGRNKPGELFGIYELAGDSLRLCLGYANTDRPKDFESGVGRNFFAFKRVRSEQLPPTKDKGDQKKGLDGVNKTQWDEETVHERGDKNQNVKKDSPLAEAQPISKKNRKTRNASIGLQTVDLAKGIVTGIEALGHTVFIPQVDSDGKTRVMAEGSSRTTSQELLFSGGLISPSHWEISIQPRTKIVIDGKPAQLPDLLARLQTLPNAANGRLLATVELEYDHPQTKKGGAWTGTAISIDVGRRFKAGIHLFAKAGITKIISVGFTNERGFDTTVGLPLVNDVEVKIDGKPAKLSDLKTNMQAWIQMSAVKDAVLGISAFGPKIEGIVKATDTEKSTISANISSLHVTADNIPISKDAKVVIDGKEATLSDLRAGMRVTLQMAADPENSLVIGIIKVAVRE